MSDESHTALGSQDEWTAILKSSDWLTAEDGWYVIYGEHGYPSNKEDKNK